MIGIIGGALGLALSYVLGKFVLRLIVGFGLGYLAFTGVGALVDSIQTYLVGILGNTASEIDQILSILNVYDGFNIIVSAYLSRTTLAPIYKRFVHGFTPTSGS